MSTNTDILLVAAALLTTVFLGVVWRLRSARAGAPAAAEAAKEAAAASTAPSSTLPQLNYEDDDEALEATRFSNAAPEPAQSALKIVYDEDAAIDEPTHNGDLILVTASAKTDRGQQRRENEDSLLVNDKEGLFVVADGMGGASGGRVASSLAVETIDRTFTTPGGEELGSELPQRARHLAGAIQRANKAVLARAKEDRSLTGMGTTVCAAWFARKKQRLYVAHVGDSRLYRLRDGALKRVTVDHTLRNLGVRGDDSSALSRVVGVLPTVSIDVILAKPETDDLYLLCSDGLTNMVPDDELASVLTSDREPKSLADKLIALANARGGKDNITAVLIRVDGTPTLAGAT